MYAGRVVEEGGVGPVMAGPLHPYAQGLPGAAVHPGMRGRRLTTIPGAPPGLETAPTGCAFAPRCALAEPACLDGVPAPRLAGPGRMARCVKVAGG
jgi:peptide/nickel transport system ATP-binding protein